MFPLLWELEVVCFCLVYCGVVLCPFEIAGSSSCQNLGKGMCNSGELCLYLSYFLLLLNDFVLLSFDNGTWLMWRRMEKKEGGLGAAGHLGHAHIYWPHGRYSGRVQRGTRGALVGGARLIEGSRHQRGLSQPPSIQFSR
jgi:hypothetical protein